MTDKSSIVVPHKDLWDKIKDWFFKKLRLTDEPAIKLYKGYGNAVHCQVFGHALSLGPLPRKKYRNIFLYNTLAVLRLFIIQPLKRRKVQLRFEDMVLEAETDADGFFKFEWAPPKLLVAGKYMAEARLKDKSGKYFIAADKAEIIVPQPSKYAFISDIDDTFLVSHSANLRKRLYVLLTENARSREPFEGVVNHYNLLRDHGTTEEHNNAFFYVSSSEWNLYDYISEFIENNNLPPGILLLSQIKRFKQVFKTGQNNHKTKFMRIARIMQVFPSQQFVLLGDDTQEDPNIYASVVKHFPGQVFCVYIRMVSQEPKDMTLKNMKEIASQGVQYCYFKHSAEAVIHSRKIGLVEPIGS